MKPKQYTLLELSQTPTLGIVLTAVGLRLGLSMKTLVAHFNGTRHPSPDRLLLLETGLHNLGAELSKIELVTPEYKIGFEGMIKLSVKTPRIKYPKRKK